MKVEISIQGSKYLFRSVNLSQKESEGVIKSLSESVRFTLNKDNCSFDQQWRCGQTILMYFIDYCGVG